MKAALPLTAGLPAARYRSAAPCALVQMVPGAAANTAAFIDPTALQMWEAGGPFQLQQDDTTKLLSNYSVYGYAAFATVFTGGVMPLGPKATA